MARACYRRGSIVQKSGCEPVRFVQGAPTADLLTRRLTAGG